jgi:hypothetical protein
MFMIDFRKVLTYLVQCLLDTISRFKTAYKCRQQRASMLLLHTIQNTMKYLLPYRKNFILILKFETRTLNVFMVLISEVCKVTMSMVLTA